MKYLNYSIRDPEDIIRLLLVQIQKVLPPSTDLNQPFQIPPQRFKMTQKFTCKNNHIFFSKYKIQDFIVLDIKETF